MGGGPAGAMLALLLARQGVAVTLLEQHEDFEREFRGDTIHPSVLENLDEMGLAERLHALPHTKVTHVDVPTPAGPARLVDFRRITKRFPYIMLLPQARFLEFIAGEARRYPSFRLVMGATIQHLVEEGGVVRGVRYRTREAGHQLLALLTVGADGRFSRLRRLGGFAPITTSAPMDVLWFRLPRRPEDGGAALMGRPGPGRILVLFDRGPEWQVGLVMPKGSYKRLHDAGIEALRRSVGELMPEFASRVSSLRDWKHTSLLSVESDRLPRWYKPGLLLIGDAAHVMSPVGGVGINYAIQDAVVAANELAGPLRAGTLRLSDLARVQRQREWPTRFIQAVQHTVQQRVLADALDASRAFTPPSSLRYLARVPLLRDLPARIIGYGLWPAHVKDGRAGRDGRRPD